MTFLKLEQKKLSKFYHDLPETVKVGAWVGLSAAITAIGGYVLDRPELISYYGIVNVILFFVKELNKKRREK